MDCGGLKMLFSFTQLFVQGIECTTELLLAANENIGTRDTYQSAVMTMLAGPHGSPGRESHPREPSESLVYKLDTHC